MFPIVFKFKFQPKKFGREKKLFICRNKFFIAVHWLTVIFIITSSFFTGVPQTNVDTFNMTLFCGEEKFNKVATPLDQRWPFLTVTAVSVTVILLIALKMVICGPEGKDFRNILNYFLGLLFCWNITYLIQIWLSYPNPSFYQNENLWNLYCCETCSSAVSKELHIQDMQSRGSFPSYITGACFYSTAFLFLLVCHLDQGRNFIAKLLALAAPGSLSFSYAWFLWKFHENHLEDVVAGALLGTFLAAYIVNEIFVKDSTLITGRAMEAVQINTVENSSGQDTNENDEEAQNLPSGEAIVLQELSLEDDLPPPYSSIIQIEQETEITQI